MGSETVFGVAGVLGVIVATAAAALMAAQADNRARSQDDDVATKSINRAGQAVDNLSVYDRQ